MPITDEDQKAIAIHVRSYAQERIDSQVKRELRWVHVVVATLGMANIGALIGLFVMLPDMAASKVLSRITNLESEVWDIAKAAGEARTAANAAIEAVTKATAAAASATAAAASATEAADDAASATEKLLATNVGEIEERVADLKRIFDENVDVGELLDAYKLAARLEFGARKSRAKDKEYKAEEDGFAFAVTKFDYNSSQYLGQLVGYVENVAVAGNEYTSETGGIASIMFPVHKGESWRIVEWRTAGEGDPAIRVFFQPLFAAN